MYFDEHWELPQTTECAMYHVNRNLEFYHTFSATDMVQELCMCTCVHLLTHSLEVCTQKYFQLRVKVYLKILMPVVCLCVKNVKTASKGQSCIACCQLNIWYLHIGVNQNLSLFHILHSQLSVSFCMGWVTVSSDHLDWVR